MGQQVFIKSLTRRKTRANDPLPSQGGKGTSGSNSQQTVNYGGTVTSYAGQSIGGANNNIALVDITDGPTRRIFSNKSTTVVVLPDVVTNFQIPGAVAVAGTASGMVYRVPRNMTIWGVAAQFGFAPTGSGTTVIDLVSCSSPTAAGTSVFVDASRKPGATAGVDYTTLGDNLTTYTGLPGGAAIQNAGNVGNSLVGTAQVGQGISGNSNAFAGSAVGLGVCTPSNAFQAPAGSFLRVEIPAVTGTIAGSALSVQIFGY